MHKRWVRIAISAGQRWMGENAFKHAGAIAFYALFSLAPVMLIAVSLAGMFFGHEAAQGELSDQLGSLIGKEGATVIERLVARVDVAGRGWMATTVGLGVLLVGATTVFVQLQDSLNTLWGVKARPQANGFLIILVRRLLSFALVLTVGFLLLISLVITTVLTILISYAENVTPMAPVVLPVLDWVLSLIVITLLFATIFRVLPDVRLKWRDVATGAFVTAVLFATGRTLISAYLGRTTLATVYGAAGSLVIVLMWIYYSTLILLFGAALTRATLEESGRKIIPRKKAVRVYHQILEEDPQ